MGKLFIAILTVCLCIVAFASPAQSKASEHTKQPKTKVLAPKAKNTQEATLKQQVHIYTVWVRRTLDDCKRDDENDQRFDEQSEKLKQDHADFRLKTMDDILTKKTAIRKEMDADLTKSIESYKAMQSNVLFSKLYLETERCYPDNFCPPGFQADQLAKMRFVELK